MRFSIVILVPIGAFDETAAQSRANRFGQHLFDARHFVMDDESMGGVCSKKTPPQKYCRYGFSTHAATTSSSLRSKANSRYCKPTIRRTDFAPRPSSAKTGARRFSNTDQAIESASFTSAWARDRRCREDADETDRVERDWGDLGRVSYCKVSPGIEVKSCNDPT